MWNDDTDRYSAVMEAELSLLSPSVRADPERLRTLLAPDFAEIGASGRRWLLDDTVAELSDESHRTAPDTSEWLFNELSPDVVLVNYRVITPGRNSRRSSIWQLSTDGPVLRFHQGTAVRDDRSLMTRPHTPQEDA